MDSTQFSKILLIQALEQSDTQAQYIPYSTRQRATQLAKKISSDVSHSSPEGSIQFIANRTEFIWDFISSSYPMITQSFRGAKIDVPPILIILPALTVGLLINGLGNSHRVNLLNFPLLLLLLWNIGVYAMTFLSSLLLKKNPAEPLLRFASRAVPKLWDMLGKGPWQKIPLSENMGEDWMIQSSERFVNLWWRQGHVVIIGHFRFFLHLGAACLALGIIFSMYFRGMVLDYRATWESTFLSPAQVQIVLHGLLGPAAWLLNFPFPGVADIARLQAPSHGSAAPWIHMWALTGFMGIILPRLLLSWISARSAHKAAKSFTLPLDEPYYLQLLANQLGHGIQIDIVPYSYHPSAAALDIVGKCLLNLTGNQAVLHWHEPVLYGQQTHPCLMATSSPQTVVLVCNLAQTPEAEVHGEVFHTLQTYIETFKEHHHMLLMLDEEPYRNLADSAHILERRLTWQRLADDYHLQMVPFNAKETHRDQLLGRCHASLWPPKRPLW